MNVPRKHIKDLLGAVKYWYIDIKDINPEIYERYTGCPIMRVRENLEYLSDNRGKAVIQVRVPLIEGYNTEEDREKTLARLAELHIMPDLFEYTRTTRERLELKADVLQGSLIDTNNIIPINEDTFHKSLLEPEMGMLLSIEELRELGKNVSLNDNDWD